MTPAGILLLASTAALPLASPGGDDRGPRAAARADAPLPHSIANVNDPRSHGALGDDLLSLEELSMGFPADPLRAQLAYAQSADFVAFSNLFSAEEGRLGVVVTFLAIMELLKESLIDFVQNEAFGPIYVRAARESESIQVTEPDESGA